MALPPTYRVADAIDESFERIGFAPSAVTPEHVVSARRSIRLLLDSWNNDSVDFWKVVSGIQHPQTVDESVFSPIDGIIDILDMAVLRDTYTTPMLTISRSDWFAIPDKDTVRGMANRVWLERLTSGFLAHIYPFAENSTDILVYDAMVQFNDSSILNGAVDIPPMWNAAFTAGLTAFLAEKFAPMRFGEKMAIYGGPGYSSPPGKPKTAYEIARMSNRERADTIMIVHSTRRPRR